MTVIVRLDSSSQVHNCSIKALARSKITSEYNRPKAEFNKKMSPLTVQNNVAIYTENKTESEDYINIIVNPKVYIMYI